MQTYTGTADANGDFSINFGTSYTGGQKVIVTAESGSASKSIELYAPSDVLGGGSIQFSGTLLNFPINIGVVTIKNITGLVQNNTFNAFDTASGGLIWSKATGLVIDFSANIGTAAFAYWSASSLQFLKHVEDFGINSFIDWTSATSLELPEGAKIVQQAAFSGWTNCTSVILPSSLENIGFNGFYNLRNCNQIICKAATPPVIDPSSFLSLKSTCIIKVPAGSVSAYQSAENWSAFASRIQAI